MTAALSLALSLSCQMPLKSVTVVAICAETQVAKNKLEASNRRDGRENGNDMARGLQWKLHGFNASARIKCTRPSSRSCQSVKSTG